MKTIGLTVLAIALVGAVAMAGDMTPEQAMSKMMNCEACKPMNEYPQLGPNIRFDMIETDNGFISTFMMADESVVPAYKECEKKCESTRAAAMEMSDEEAKEKLCPFCVGMRKVMAREDVTVNTYPTTMGSVTVAEATSEEGTKALHNYAAMAKETSNLLAEATMKMMQEGHEGHDH
ncbi:MAG: hypothetical protein GF341_06485 [candidate division Zixibacteria bacterium]|nr:hypothetical protein [candidate division Zixibacteria bacterium]